MNRVKDYDGRRLCVAERLALPMSRLSAQDVSISNPARCSFNSALNMHTLFIIIYGQAVLGLCLSYMS